MTSLETTFLEDTDISLADIRKTFKDLAKEPIKMRTKELIALQPVGMKNFDSAYQTAFNELYAEYFEKAVNLLKQREDSFSFGVSSFD